MSITPVPTYEVHFAGEERFLNLGSTNQGRILLVVTTWREHRIRVVSAFAPAKRLVRFYLTEKGK